MRGAAAKRKRGAANSAAQEAQANKLTSLSILRPTDEKELAIQIEKARSGSNDELNRRKTIIEREIDKRIASSDRLRKLQIKNINDLYEYDVSALQAQRERSLQEAEDKYVDELQAQVEYYKQRSRQAKASADASAIQTTNDGTAPQGERSLRSLHTGNPKEIDWPSLMKEKERPAPPRRRQATAVQAASAIEKKLDEAEMKTDFRTIVKDLEQRAAQFKDLSHTKSTNTYQAAVRVDSAGQLWVDQLRIVVGDVIEVYSLLSDETFPGIVTIIDSQEIIVRTEPGPRFSFPLRLVRAGRVILRHSLELALKDPPIVAASTSVPSKIKKLIASEKSETTDQSEV